jgi:ABC-type uncharacterized transport system YnjBCD substrate-binding protein
MIYIYSLFNEVVVQFCITPDMQIKEQEKEFINTPSITSDLKTSLKGDVSKTALQLHLKTSFTACFM